MKNKLLSSAPISTNLASLILRLLFGILFAHYGYTKISMFDVIVPQFPDYLGIGGKGALIVVIIAEFVGGILIAIGLFTRLATIPIFITMAVAFFVAHANDPFQVKQIAFVYLILAPVIFLLGGGKYSIDSLIFKK